MFFDQWSSSNKRLRLYEMAGTRVHVGATKSQSSAVRNRVVTLRGVMGEGHLHRACATESINNDDDGQIVAVVRRSNRSYTWGVCNELMADDVNCMEVMRR